MGTGEGGCGGGDPTPMHLLSVLMLSYLSFPFPILYEKGGGNAGIKSLAQTEGGGGACNAPIHPHF